MVFDLIANKSQGIFYHVENATGKYFVLKTFIAIITAIAEGHTRMSEIASKVGMESSACSKYISVLLSLGILSKVTPVIEKSGRKTVYKVSDLFFLFWYRFVPQNITAIASGRMDRIFDKAVTSRLSDYMGLIFEQMCREYLLFYDDSHNGFYCV